MGETRRVARVLVADDTVTVRLLLRRTLEMSTVFDVVGEAADGAQAVDLAAELQPDIVLLDLSMPVLDGMEAIPRIRRDAPEARIVVLSGFGRDGLGAQAVEAGATAFLEKSQRPAELIAALQEIWMSAEPEPEPPADPYRRAWDDAPVAMALVGSGDRVLDANRAWSRLTGRAGDSAAALTDLIHPADREATAAATRRVAEGRSATSTVEARLVRPDGGTAWASFTCSASEGAVVVAMVDITEQKRSQREMTRSNAELSTFAHLAAHELKSPLQAICGFAALLDRVHGSELDEHGRESVGWILDGATRMNSVIEDLLAYCAVDRTEAVMGPVDLETVFLDARDQLKADLADREAEIEAGPLPVVTGDPVQLGQVLQHLLANALKFVDGDLVPRIQVTAERASQAWVVSVADNGIGVAEQARERIFGMFERLHPRERYTGTGIGLSICKRILERRGGTIWVEANPGGGSRFRFSLPDVLSLPGEVSAA